MGRLLKLLLMNFNIVGINPFNRNYLAHFLCILTYFSTIILTMASVLDMILEWRGMDTLDDFYMFPLVLIFPAKLTCIAFRKDMLIKMVGKIEKFWPQDKFGSEVAKKMDKINRTVFNIVAGFGGLYIFLCACHIGVPLALNEKALIYPGLYFCNLTTSPCFEIVHTWQIIVLGLQITPTIFGFESLFICFVNEAFCSIEMVKTALKRFKSADVDAKQKIGEIVNQHAIILSFIDDMRTFYNETLLLQFWSSLGTMVFSLYMLTSEGFPPTSGLIIKFGGTFYFLSVQILIYCFGGSLVLEQTLTVANEAYFVDWWATASVRGDLALIIERSQKSSKLLVGNMSTLNLEQFLTVLRNAFNVYGLLMTMKQDD